GRGGISAVSQITGVARSTIGRGLMELRDGATAEPDRVRRPGGGRKPLMVKDATLLDDLRSLVEPSTRGDPQAALLWTAKSLRNLAAGLRELGHQISYSVVRELLRSLGYSLQANRKTREGGNHPDRDSQFGENTGWVSVGVDHDTASFAVNAIRRWWQTMGQARYRNAKSLLITADGGGSNGTRLRLWKLELQRLADELGLAITVCHLPPGTS